MSKETAEHSDVTKTRAEEEPGLIPENICFVVMPYGRDTAEKRWFKGWYEMVINPGVLAARYRPILAAAEEQPGAINDEIRAHCLDELGRASVICTVMGGNHHIRINCNNF